MTVALSGSEYFNTCILFNLVSQIVSVQITSFAPVGGAIHSHSFPFGACHFRESDEDEFLLWNNKCRARVVDMIRHEDYGSFCYAPRS